VPKDFFLALVNNPLNLRYAHVVTFRDLFVGQTANQTIAKDVPMPFVMDPFVNRIFDLTVPVLNQRAFTRPEPPQVPHVLY